VPLKTPYKLAFGPLYAFDMVLVEVCNDHGDVGWGEATMLTGYTKETIEQAWTTAKEIADGMVGRQVVDLKAGALEHHPRTPFIATAFVSAVELAEGHQILRTDQKRRVPLLAIVNATEFAAIADEVDARLSEGYRTLKVKAGFDLAEDMHRLAFIQDHVAGRARLRVDANQGYSKADGIALVAGMAPDGIELVEQTCAAGDWDAAVAVANAARGSGIRVMLDESIFVLEDVDRAADLNCADIIKLKLLKAGGLDALTHGLAHIRAKGMGRVLGNGVAGDIGCWMEACVAACLIDNAGEMNGFLKPSTRLFEVPMYLESGSLVLTNGQVRADLEALEHHMLDRFDDRRGGRA
jgi:L-alanine-DL-glutamate epimerase-like enolase superfamily enzyme